MRDLSGQRFGSLTVLKFFGKSTYKNNSSYKWVCLCDCGVEKVVEYRNLKGGSTKSCGCQRFLKVAENFKNQSNHGFHDTPTYKAWSSMKGRCLVPTHQAFHNYGGRGISVCDRWMNSFENFLADMGERPSPNHSLDRKDNDGDYTPTNCRWATRLEQVINRRNTILIEIDNKKRSITEWCLEFQSAKFGIDKNLAYARLKKGWRAADAFTKPKRKWS